MTEQSPEKQKLNPLEKGNQFLKTSISLFGSISVLGSGLGWTVANATTDTLAIPDVPSASPESTAPAPEPVRAERKVQLSAPKISVTQPPIRQSEPNFVKNSYIDQTNYNVGNSQPQTKPSTVVITERKTGCQTVVTGSSVSGGNCGVARIKPPQRKTESLATNYNSPTDRNTNSNTHAYRRGNLNSNTTARVYREPASSNSTRQVRLTRRDLSQIALTGQTKPYSSRRAGHYTAKSIQSPPGDVFYSDSIKIEPLNSNPPEYSRAPRQLVEQALQYGQGNTSLIFPVSIPASISSAFGWRTHPITGTQRMHSGTDIAAPMGTPVLAAYPGEVETADSLGGYGLTVILRHLDGTQESRYAHLSQILVQPGQWVEQGAVIGLVGSTGFSTGPHLHFEWRHKTEQGWIAVDAGLHLQMAADNMIRALQNAQSQTNPNNG